MAELTTLARPYAKAAFEYALQDGALAPWSQMLRLTATVTREESVQTLLKDPILSAGQVAQAVIDICAEDLDAKGTNFVRLLAENRRLELLPEISMLFDNLKLNQERAVDVEISTAHAISSEVSGRLVEALKKRLQREINLTTSVDAALIGGAIIRAGDTVIDYSVRGKLTKLAESLAV